MPSSKFALAPKLGVFLRYGAGSLVAMGCSELVLVGSYDLFGLGPEGASILAWVAGAVPNYVLNRRWAWRSTDRRTHDGRTRELVLYWAITLVTAASAIAATTGTDALIRGSVPARGAQSLLLAATYLCAYGVIFIVKFVLFDRWVFADRRSRPGIPSTSQA
jgi:putative flippase GtrA